MRKFDDFFDEKMQDPEIKKEYEELTPEFDIIRAMVEARMSCNLTQKELAEKTGINQADISKLENGTRNPSLKLLKRLADGMVLLAKSKRASERLLESSTKYLEEKLKLTVNRKKSRTVSVFAIRKFKFLGFTLGRNGSGIYVRVHPKSWKKFKSKLKTLSSRKKCQSIKPSLEEIKVYARGWLNYYGIASMKNNIEDINGWLYHRIRMCIWKQWKLPKTKKRNLIRMGIPEYYAHIAANSRKGHWFSSNLTTVKRAMLKERLINSGFYDLATAYQSVHVNY